MIIANRTVLSTAVTALLVGALRTALPARAGIERAYPTDGENRPILSGSGGCVHSGSWKESMPTCPEPTVVVEEGQGKIVFSVDDAEFFGFDQVQLSDQTKADLDAMVGAVENADMIHGVTITGHADRIGPAPYNENLALRRAQAVKDYLVARGIPAERIETLSDGSSRPLFTCPHVKNERKLIRCLAPNRRVDIEALLADTVDVATVTLSPAVE